MKRGLLTRYHALLDSGALIPDAAQAEAAERLQDLHEQASAYCRSKSSLFARSRPVPKGLYLWGAVGRGKTLLMDLLFNNTNIADKRRVHFHEFMSETHDRIATWRASDGKARRQHKHYNKANPDDPIAPVAGDVANEALLLCFDEFQVTDITDAMILGRLFEALFARGVVIVATSNRHPDDLYKDGLNRQLFLPFIDLLKQKTDMLELKSDRDYRLDKLKGAPVYYTPLDAEAEKAMDAAWARMLSGASDHKDKLQVKGRTLIVSRAARGAARFDFSDLCERPLGAYDYLAIVRHYSTIFIDHIPRLDPSRRDAARRFVNLIDTIYDARAKLVCSAAAEPTELYPQGDGAFEFERTASRLIEMRSKAYLAAEAGTVSSD